MRRLSKYQRRGLIAAGLIVLSLPWVLHGQRRGVAEILTLSSRWLPPDSQDAVALRNFISRFESGDFVLVSWPDCTLEDVRLDAVTLELFREHRDYFDSVTTGKALIQRLQESLELPRRVATERLIGIVLGPDGSTTCALISLTEQGAYCRRDALQILTQKIADAIEVDEEDLHLAGPPVDGAVADWQSIFACNVLGTVSLVLSALLCWWCLRSIAFSAAILLIATFGQAAVLACIHYAGGLNLSAVLIVLPPLILVLTISSGVHLVSYYHDEVKRHGEFNRHGMGGAVSSALARGGWPCAIATTTTAIGLGSLALSRIEPVRDFGILAPPSVIGTFGLLWATLPGVWETRPRSRLREVSGLARDSANCSGDARRAFDLSRMVCGWLLQRADGVALVCLLTMGAAAVGLVSLRSSIDFDSLYAANSRIHKDYAYLESRIGPLVSLEIILGFEADHDFETIERVELLRQVENEVKQNRSIGTTFSAATFCPKLPAAAGTSSLVRRKVINRRLERNLAEFGAMRLYCATQGGREYWRITARVPALAGIDHGQCLNNVRRSVQPIIAQHSGVSAEYTGIMPLVAKAQQLLMRDLLVSFLTAFGIVAVIMVPVIGSIPGALLAMLPNLFPAVVVFGLMGWLDIPVDIGAMMTASVALGIAVDDTLHLLAWFRTEATSKIERAVAVESAMRHCGRAMLHTTLICGLGMAAFAFSDFIPTRRFAVLMLTLLVAALLGDLVFLPALLAGRFGRLFSPSLSPDSPSTQSPPVPSGSTQ